MRTCTCDLLLCVTNNPTLFCVPLQSLAKDNIAMLLPIVLDRNRAPHRDKFIEASYLKAEYFK